MAMKLVKKTAADGLDPLKQQFIDCVRQEKNGFSEIVKPFYKKNYRDKEDYLNLSQAIIDAVNHVMAAGNWEESLFLRNTLKPLKEIRAQAVTLRQQAMATAGSEEKYKLRPLSEEEMLVYISIFQSVGDDLAGWALQIASLRSHLLGRPVYTNEVDVRKVLRQKLLTDSEAYVVVAIKRTDIEDSIHQFDRVDRYGNSLLTLKETAVKTTNIFEFVHHNKRYFYKSGKLILQEGSR